MDIRPSIVRDLLWYKKTRDPKFWNRALDELADQVLENIEFDKEIDGQALALFYQMTMMPPPKRKK